MTDTLGQLLRGAREARGETLDDVERVTHIRARQLTAIEADDFGALPSPAQARGYIKNYAQHLGLDLQDVLARYEAAQSKRPAGQATRPPRSRPDLSGTSRSPTAPQRPAVPPQMRSAQMTGTRSATTTRPAAGTNGAPATPSGATAQPPPARTRTVRVRRATPLSAGGPVGARPTVPRGGP